jgi:hypothetical protein
MCHNTTVHNPAFVISINNTDRSRASGLFVRLRILLPLRVLANPVNGILPENGTSLVTIMNIEDDMIPVEVSVGVSALAGCETSLPGFGLGNSNVNSEVLHGAGSGFEARGAVNKLT